MDICKSCEKEKCFFRGSLNVECPQYKAKPQTNADRIRAMSDEELADWIARTQISNIEEALEIAKIPWEHETGLKEEVAREALDWLKQPAEVDNG